MFSCRTIYTDFCSVIKRYSKKRLENMVIMRAIKLENMILYNAVFSKSLIYHPLEKEKKK